jgi:hypothetical protein
MLLLEPGEGPRKEVKMERFRGGQKVARGMYLNLKSGEFSDARSGGIVLPGSEASAFVKVPAFLPFVAGPFAGLVYIVLMPFFALVVIASGLLVKGKNLALVRAKRQTIEMRAK